MSKSSEPLPNSLQIAETNVILIVFIGVLWRLCEIHVYTVTVFCRRSSIIRYQTSYILVSHRIYIYSQCNLTAQLETVQDQMYSNNNLLNIGCIRTIYISMWYRRCLWILKVPIARKGNMLDVAQAFIIGKVIERASATYDNRQHMV
jgi:hypothetical protein